MKHTLRYKFKRLTEDGRLADPKPTDFTGLDHYAYDDPVPQGLFDSKDGAIREFRHVRHYYSGLIGETDCPDYVILEVVVDEDQWY